jgi:hypothetical protein
MERGIPTPSVAAAVSTMKRSGSFFPSSCAVNPALTIMANALRVGDHQPTLA